MSERAIITGYALADMDERRKLEAEVERLRGLLKEAESGLRYAYGRLHGRAAFAARPEVRRALGEIGGEG